MSVKFTSKIDKLDKIKLHHIIIEKSILEKTCPENHEGSIYNQRFDVTLNGTVKWKGGSVSLGNETAYITVSQARMKKLDIVRGDTVEVELEPDSSKYGMDVPEEWTESLELDPEAKAIFDSMPISHQRYVIYYIQQVKSSQKRIERSLFCQNNMKRAPVNERTVRQIVYGKDLP